MNKVKSTLIAIGASIGFAVVIAPFLNAYVSTQMSPALMNLTICGVLGYGIYKILNK